MTRNRSRTVKARIRAELAAKGKPVAPATARFPSVGTVYLIRDQSGLHKIGLTRNWERRSRELKVGTKTTAVMTATVINPERVEATLHQRFATRRLPQSEWFSLSPEQLQEVMAAIETEAAKAQGPDADGHLALERMLYECGQLEKGSAAWRYALGQIEAQRRKLCPEYRARAEAREAEREAAAARYAARVAIEAERRRRNPLRRKRTWAALAFLAWLIANWPATVASAVALLLAPPASAIAAIYLCQLAINAVIYLHQLAINARRRRP